MSYNNESEMVSGLVIYKGQELIDKINEAKKAGTFTTGMSPEGLKKIDPADVVMEDNTLSREQKLVKLIQIFNDSMETPPADKNKAIILALGALKY